MKRVTLVLALLALDVLVGGCVSKRSGIVIEDGASWTVGETTAKEVVAEWGNPRAIRGNVWIWRMSTSLGGKVRASYMALGATVSSQKSSIGEYRLTFDENNVLREVETLESIPGGPSWTIFPWY